MSKFDGLAVTVHLGHDDVDRAEYRMIPASGGDVAFPVVWLGGLTLMAAPGSDLAAVLRQFADGVDHLTGAARAAA
jgi:hypothetical protein